MKNSIHEIFSELLEEAIKHSYPSFRINSVNFMISEPRIPQSLNQDRINYHLSSNIAMVIASQFNTKPQQLAQLICDYLIDSKLVENVSVTKPGFINVRFGTKILRKFVSHLANNSKFGSAQVKPLSVNIEFVSVNPTGYLHAGHTRNAVVGDTLARILSYAGYEVTKEYYINDAGNQIDILANSAFVRYQQQFKIEANLPEDSYQGQDIIQFAKYVKSTYNDYFLTDFEAKRSEFKKIAVDWFMNQIKTDLAKIKVSFDRFTSEKAIYETGAINKALKILEPHTYQQDNALYLRTSMFGDDKDRVLIKSDGSYTYFLPDVAYHQIKAKSYKKLINVWGADHSGYVVRLVSSLILNGFNKEDIQIVIIQLVRLIKNNQEFKMSKRKGTSITLRYLLNYVSSDALRYNLASRDANSKLDLDIDQVTKMDDNNPVLILKNSYLRANNLLNNSHSLSMPKTKDYQFNQFESDLIIELSNFKNIILTITKTHKIQLLSQHLMKITNIFNTWYNNENILKSQHKFNKIQLVKAYLIVLKRGLKLLGISYRKN